MLSSSKPNDFSYAYGYTLTRVGTLPFTYYESLLVLFVLTVDKSVDFCLMAVTHT